MPRWLTGLILLFLVGHAACRALSWNHLEYDEAEQLVLVQSLEWGYYYQPPLYTWLLLPWIKLLGPTIFPLLIVRTVLFLVMFRLMYALTFRVTQHERFASLMTLTTLLVPEVFHGAIGMWPHTMLMVVCILATLLLILRLADEKSWRDYLLLGLCGGWGILSKYNYAHFVAAIVLSMVMIPRWRTVLLDRRMAVAMILAALLAAPHGWWMVQHLDEVRHGVVRYTEEKQDQFSSWADTAKHIGINIVQNVSRSNGFLLLPLLLIFVPGWRNTQRNDGEVVPELHRLLIRFYVIGAILLALAMIAGGVLHIRQHWLTAFAMLLPVLVLSRVDPDKLKTWQWRSYQGMMILLVFGALAWRGGLIAWHGEQGCLSAQSYQYLAYANKLRDSGWNATGTAIVDQPYTAAYLRLHFPQAHVHCLYLPMVAKPKSMIDDRVLITWRERVTRENRKIREHLKATLGIDSGNWGEPLVVDEPGSRLADDSLRLISVIVPAPARSEAVPTVQINPGTR
jgi:4-amino-4-deoxy-L-arabinose transferase-like glycosyltransferase